jgi:hypothetical protein
LYKIVVGKPYDKRPLDAGVDGRIILKRIINKREYGLTSIGSG